MASNPTCLSKALVDSFLYLETILPISRLHLIKKNLKAYFKLDNESPDGAFESIVLIIKEELLKYEKLSGENEKLKEENEKLKEEYLKQKHELEVLKEFELDRILDASMNEIQYKRISL